MAKLVLTNASVSIAGTDLSSSITNITLETKYDIIETTTFGNTAKTRVAGLADNQITLDFTQDYGSSSVESIIYPLLGTTTTVIIQPVAGSATTTNPKYTVTALVSDWTPIKGGVGQLATASVTWPISGTITKAFS
jgi:hypothetical protein